MEKRLKTELKEEKTEDEISIEYFQRIEHYRIAEKNNPYIEIAKKAAIKYSKTPNFPIGIIAVKDGLIIAENGNGNGYHQENINSPLHKNGCIRSFKSNEREEMGLPKFKSGEFFDICPGCHTDYHAEANLIRECIKREDLKDADIYMYGHFWCCKDCWEKMKNVGIKNVFLPYNFEDFKDKEKIKVWAEYVKNLKGDTK